MAEILLLYSTDKSGAAARLRDAIAACGRAVREEELAATSSADEILAKAGGVSAALLVWSRPLISGILIAGGFKKLRQQSNLIQVSFDGLTPPSAADENHTILLSGWRSQPYHPGWVRIWSELDRLCSPVGMPTVAAGARDKLAARGADRSTTVAPGRLRRTRIALPAIVILVALVAWVSSIGLRSASSRLAGPSQALSPAAQPAALVDATAPPGAHTGRIPDDNLALQPELSVEQVQEPSTTGLQKAEPLPAVPITLAEAAPSPTSSIARQRLREEPAEEIQRQVKVLGKPSAPAKRYSRKYSGPMKLFCARSGRRTPECKEFLRETRRARR